MEFLQNFVGVGELPERGVFGVTVNFSVCFDFVPFDKNWDYRRGIVFMWHSYPAL
jgi:hypothetical protein